MSRVWRRCLHVVGPLVLLMACQPTEPGGSDPGGTGGEDDTGGTDEPTPAGCVDADGDGAFVGSDCSASTLMDCDDNDALRSPNRAEILFDGFDDDCDGYDDVDEDDDGYPGMLRGDWRSFGPGHAYPPDVFLQLDCSDTDPRINPAAVDHPYDGVDADCGGEDDWDADGDGYVPDADQLPREHPYFGPLPAGDCDDTRPDVHPDVERVDLPYDGVDANCDGSNDWDADGDGIMPTYLYGQHVEVGFNAFVERYGYHHLNARYGDCDDSDASVFPNATDRPYDGVDADCDGGSDWDLDGDGYVPSAASLPPGSATYVGLLPTGDCDDTDASVRPGALEVLGDARDSDCDGGLDSTPLALHSDLSGEGTRAPVVGGIDGMYLLVAAADYHESAYLSGSESSGVFLRFPTDDGLPGPRPQAVHPAYWEFGYLGTGVDPTGRGGVFSQQFDVEFRPEGFYIAISRHFPLDERRRNQLRLYRLRRMDDSYSFERRVTNIDGFGTTDAQYTGIDLEQGPDDAWFAVGCTAGVLHARMAYADDTGWEGVFNTDSVVRGASTNQCAVQPTWGSGNTPTALVRGFGFSQVNYTVGAEGDIAVAAPPVDPVLGALRPEQVVQRDGVLALSTDDGLVVAEDGNVLGTYLAGETVHWASAMFRGEDLYAVAVVADRDNDGRDDLLLLYGDPAAPTVTKLPVRLAGGAAAHVLTASVWVDDDRVMLGVSVEDGAEDRYGWAFLAPAE